MWFSCFCSSVSDRGPAGPARMIEILNQPQLFVLLHLQAIKAAYIIYHVATYLALHDSVYILK